MGGIIGAVSQEMAAQVIEGQDIRWIIITSTLFNRRLLLASVLPSVARKSNNAKT